jgi:hypothetical protein
MERKVVGGVIEHGKWEKEGVGSERAIGKSSRVVGLAGNWCSVEKQKLYRSLEAVAF